MRALITQDTIMADRLRRMNIYFLQCRIDRCMTHIENGGGVNALTRLVTLVNDRNELYTESELREKALKRGLA
jgi:hypothetical protein